MENPFFSGVDTGIRQVVPLAMKKWELDQQNEQWQKQMLETKRQHDINLGTSLLASGNVEEAAKLLSGAMGGEPLDLVNSPANRLKTAQTDEALRLIKAKTDTAAEMKGLLAPKTVERPVGPADIGTESGLIPGVAAGPTEKISTPGDVNLHDVLRIMAKNGVIDASLLGGFEKEQSLLHKESALDVKEKIADAVNEIRKYGYDKNFEAALVRAASSDNKPSQVPYRDTKTGEIFYKDKNNPKDREWLRLNGPHLQAIAENPMTPVIREGLAPEPSKSASPYKSADEVRAAFKAKKLSKDESLKILRRDFGME